MSELTHGIFDTREASGPTPFHQFSRGQHALCGLEITEGMNGTRRTADVTCPECLAVRERIETGYKVFKLKPEAGDVVVIGIGPQPTEEDEFNHRVERAMALTEQLRKDFPEVSFCILTDENKVEHLKEADMNVLGWHRGNSITKKGKRFGFKNGKIQKK